jgi:anti-sigma B factor antagonist
MMIYEDVQGAKVILTPEGRLDAQSAPELELKTREINDKPEHYQFLVKELVFDFSKLTYISSIGLRVVLQAQKMMKARQGKFSIQNIAPAVRDVFEVTGLVDLFVKDERLIVIQQSKTHIKTVLSVVGTLDAKTVPILQAQLKSLADEKVFDVRLDLTGLHFISDDACVALTNAKQRMQDRNGRLVLQDADAPETVKQTLSLHGL